MVFRIFATLKFANAAQRTAGHTTINNAISGRGTSVIIDNDVVHPDGSLCLCWEGHEEDTGDAGIIYALIQAMSTPLPGSVAEHHTCFHDEGPFPEGDPRNTCIPTAKKVWA